MVKFHAVPYAQESSFVGVKFHNHALTYEVHKNFYPLNWLYIPLQAVQNHQQPLQSPSQHQKYGN